MRNNFKNIEESSVAYARKVNFSSEKRICPTTFLLKIKKKLISLKKREKRMATHILKTSEPYKNKKLPPRPCNRYGELHWETFCSFQNKTC